MVYVLPDLSWSNYMDMLIIWDAVSHLLVSYLVDVKLPHYVLH